MRRPINWFVFCLSLAFLFANVTLGHKPIRAEGQIATPQAVESGFSRVFVEERVAPQFGYVRDDGSFEPLPEQPGPAPDVDETVWSHWSEATSAAAKVPTRF